ncbi:histone acetyltransferase subunit NuA4-domain-containing protein [Usnea florida]
MAENIPPPDNTRGVPYYEKLKRDLRDTLQKKRVLDKNMAALEDQIYRYESSYLEETGPGNIIKGFDNYIKGSTTAGTTSANTGGGTSTRRKGQVLEVDRVFSRSSASFMRELSPTSSAQTTPSHAPTPTSGVPNGPLSARESSHATPISSTSMKAGQNNKKKKAERDEDNDDGRGPKRLKITYARGGVGD